MGERGSGARANGGWAAGGTMRDYTRSGGEGETSWADIAQPPTALTPPWVRPNSLTTRWVVHALESPTQPPDILAMADWISISSPSPSTETHKCSWRPPTRSTTRWRIIKHRRTQRSHRPWADCPRAASDSDAILRDLWRSIASSQTQTKTSNNYAKPHNNVFASTSRMDV